MSGCGRGGGGKGRGGDETSGSMQCALQSVIAGIRKCASESDDCPDNERFCSLSAISASPVPRGVSLLEPSMTKLTSGCSGCCKVARLFFL
jgi:hypothetical protein